MRIDHEAKYVSARRGAPCSRAYRYAMVGLKCATNFCIWASLSKLRKVHSRLQRKSAACIEKFGLRHVDFETEWRFGRSGILGTYARDKLDRPDLEYDHRVRSGQRRLAGHESLHFVPGR